MKAFHEIKISNRYGRIVIIMRKKELKKKNYGMNQVAKEGDQRLRRK